MKKADSDGTDNLLAQRKIIEKNLASEDLTKEQKTELKNKMKKIDQVLKEQQKKKELSSGDIPPPPPPKKK